LHASNGGRPPVGIPIHHRATGIINFAVKVGVIFHRFLQDRVGPFRCGKILLAACNGEIHRNQIARHQEGTLVIQGDLNSRVFGRQQCLNRRIAVGLGFPTALQTKCRMPRIRFFTHPFQSQLFGACSLALFVILGNRTRGK
jgi:hypothetical protein